MNKTFHLFGNMISVSVNSAMASADGTNQAVVPVSLLSDLTTHYHATYTCPVRDYKEGMQKDVLSFILLDATTFIQSESIDDFAENYCQGLKVGEALRVYEACKEAAEFFRESGLTDEQITLNHEEEDWYING